MKDVLETKYVPLVRLQVVKERFLPYGKEEIVVPEKVVKMVKRLLEGADKECILVIPVDVRSRPLGVEFAAVGALNCAHSFPREIYKNALISNAFGVIIVHNHMSNNVHPSEDDWRFTRRMQDAGDLLGVELLDHIIIGDSEEYFSMRETHLWEFRETK